MSVNESIPIVTCDARKRESTKQTLISLVDTSLDFEPEQGSPPRTRGGERMREADRVRSYMRSPR